MRAIRAVLADTNPANTRAGSRMATEGCRSDYEERVPLRFFFGLLVLPVLACSSSAAAPASSGSDNGGPVVPIAVGTSPVRGPADAWVTMIEFADFECPFCGEEEPVVEALLDAYPEDLRLVFKNFPLTAIHPNAQAAALAAECAGAQGDFWPMHDLLFANQSALDGQSLLTYAQSAGVDTSSWQACLSTQPPVDAIGADVSLGTSVGVAGTPTFFVNGEVVVGAVPQSALQDVIEAKRSEAQASGVPRAQYYDQVILGQ
jgi:protein-disulfide isomerase